MILVNKKTRKRITITLTHQVTSWTLDIGILLPFHLNHITHDNVHETDLDPDPVVADPAQDLQGEEDDPAPEVDAAPEAIHGGGDLGLVLPTDEEAAAAEDHAPPADIVADAPGVGQDRRPKNLNYSDTVVECGLASFATSTQV